MKGQNSDLGLASGMYLLDLESSHPMTCSLSLLYIHFGLKTSAQKWRIMRWDHTSTKTGRRKWMTDKKDWWWMERGRDRSWIWNSIMMLVVEMCHLLGCCSHHHHVHCTNLDVGWYQWQQPTPDCQDEATAPECCFQFHFSQRNNNASQDYSTGGHLAKRSDL